MDCDPKVGLLGTASSSSPTPVFLRILHGHWRPDLATMRQAVPLSHSNTPYPCLLTDLLSWAPCRQAAASGLHHTFLTTGSGDTVSEAFPDTGYGSHKYTHTPARSGLHPLAMPLHTYFLFLPLLSEHLNIVTGKGTWP